MAKKSLPQLDFDSSGSATVRFFGSITQLGIHYANAKLSMLKMVCPKSINASFHCGVCESGSSTNPRNLAIGWDCRMKRWAIYLGTIGTFHDIFEQCKAAGATGKMMSDGTGPDVMLQRVGSHTEVVVAPDTIGQERGDDLDFEPMTVIKILNEVAKESAYARFDTIAEVEAAHPKIQAVPGFSGYHGMSSYSGTSGYRNLGVSGSTGYSAYNPYAAERLELLRQAESKHKIEVMAEPAAIKARPKLLKDEEVKEMPTGEDRWDLLG